jgi:Carboxypeptidase regulatory-like domain
MSMRRFLLKLLVLTIALTLPSLLRAQSVASMTGTVTDTSGAVVPDANVELVNSATGTVYKVKTNSTGSYTVPNVVPGPGYKVTFSREGFESVVISGLYLNVDVTRTQNARLPVGREAVTVEVSASSQNVTLNTTDATVGNSFEVQYINDLPISNRDSPAALFTQQPGVTLDGAVTGARVDQNNVTVDGLDVNDNATGNFGAIVGNAPVDSVQEFRGVTAGPLSSAGEGGGGQFELVTRGGTNQFHGAAVEYHRDTDLEANDWFNNNAGVPRPPLIRNQFGGNFGGPALKNKLFFFFDYNGRRDTLSALEERAVPINAFRSGDVSYINSTGGISSLTPAQVKNLDPSNIGFNSALLSLINSRYPAANDLSGAVGDLINTAGFRFNAPFPYAENDYVGRVDYNLKSSMKLFGRVTFTRTNSTQNAIQFPGDPQTFPFLDKSYAWVVGHTWTIGNNKVNQATYGEVYENLAFPNTYNPTGITQYNFGGNGTGGEILSGAYASAINAQKRTYPVPVIKDDFSWQKGKHSLAFGGTFKYINPNGNTILDYNSPLLGLGGNLPSLDPTLRPTDIDTSTAGGPVAASTYDSAFALALGHYGSVSSTFNYNAAGTAVPQGTGSQQDFRYYETELYVGDTWKVTPTFTVSYGLRWQNYSVPYEKSGLESVPNVTFDQYFTDRITQSTAGQSGNQAVPFISYSLGGKANNAPGYFSPIYKNFAPRFAFAYSADPKTVFNGGAGIIYDHTVVNAVQFQQSQYSYLFQSSATVPYGVAGNAPASLVGDLRFSGVNNPPPTPTAPPITKPFLPFISGTGTSAVPTGLANGQAFNESIDKNLKTPYSIGYNFGFQHEFPEGFLLKMSYVGRLGRRLLGQADANQLIDFPDTASGQFYSAAFASLTQQLRAGVNPLNVAAQPWFEHVIPPGTGTANGFASNSALVAFALATLVQRGDFADTNQQLAAAGLIPPNVGMGAQFSENTFYTNKGFSGYNGLLTTLHKNAGHGLQFDINYTWSHSIDNVSLTANTPALGGYGFICDALRPRECRGNSDFDVTHYISGNFLYDLPFGRGQTFAATAPWWLNEVIGGWGISGIPSWHSGNAYQLTSNAFVAGYANEAPAILVGPLDVFKSHLNKGPNGTLFAFKDTAAALAQTTGPVGFQIGSRNPLRGPQYFDFDMGVGKTFPVYKDKVNLKFRADAFNVFNHPSFNPPSVSSNQSQNAPGSDITNAQFGTVSTAVANGLSTNSTSRVLQGALRLEF